jgi:hypothetical protein
MSLHRPSEGDLRQAQAQPGGWLLSRREFERLL